MVQTNARDLQGRPALVSDSLRSGNSDADAASHAYEAVLVIPNGTAEPE